MDRNDDVETPTQLDDMATTRDGHGPINRPAGPDPAGLGRFLTSPCNSTNPSGRVDQPDPADHGLAERDPDPARLFLKPTGFGPNPPSPAVVLIFLIIMLKYYHIKNSKSLR